MEDRLEAPGAAGKLEESEPGFLTGGCICPSQVEHLQAVKPTPVGTNVVRLPER